MLNFFRKELNVVEWNFISTLRDDTNHDDFTCGITDQSIWISRYFLPESFLEITTIVNLTTVWAGFELDIRLRELWREAW